MRFARNITILAGTLIVLPLVSAESPYTETRATLEKWVETRQLISKTHSDWQGARETLQQNLQLFQKEIAAVAEQSSKLTTNSTQIDKERRDAEAGKQAAEECLKRAREFAGPLESAIKSLLPVLPSPLRETLQPLANRLPSDPNTKLTAAERLQVIVGILNEIDKFNSSISVFSEKRRNAQGQEVAVETVYVGLGAAYFASDTGDFAGTGSPTKDGWDWNIRNELGASVREVVRIYRNERPAQFVSLPASIR